MELIDIYLNFRVGVMSMIRKIIINNLATYKTPVEIIPKKLGNNGSLSTAIANFLGRYVILTDSSIEKSAKRQRFYAIKNFSDLSDVPGVFTLCEDLKIKQGELAQIITII